MTLPPVKLLQTTIRQVLIDLGFSSIEVNLERSTRESHGDFVTTVALQLYPQLNMLGLQERYSSPRILAETIAALLNQKIDALPVSRFEVAGPGFINIFLSDTQYLKTIATTLSLKDTFGHNQLLQGKTVIVEYSSPNIAKPFTFGHLRSTVIGDAIANLLTASGATVLRDNHIGDWGTQFGKQIYALKTWGNLDEIERSSHPVTLLVALYVKFHEEAEKDPSLNESARQWFKRLEQHDPEALFIWQKCIAWSWQEFKRIYDLLHIYHSQEFENGKGLGESFFEDKMAAVVAELKQAGLLKEGKEGAQLVFFKDNSLPPAMILKKDGSTLYHTRDLATDKYRKDTFHPDIIINEVGSEQELYFKQLFEIERLLGWFKPSQRIHIGHGFVRFKDRKMSTRKGDVVWLEDVIEEAIKRASALNQNNDPNIAQIVAIGALKWNDLKGAAARDIVFDWDEVLNMKGNAGPYLQYTYVRAASVLNKATDPDSFLQYRFSEDPHMNEEERAVLTWISRFPETVTSAAATYAPHQICTYLYELAQRFNTFYNRYSILGTSKRPVPSNISAFRLQITAATGIVIKNGLELLGIDTPERM